MIKKTHEINCEIADVKHKIKNCCCDIQMNKRKMEEQKKMYENKDVLLSCKSNEHFPYFY